MTVPKQERLGHNNETPPPEKAPNDAPQTRAALKRQIARDQELKELAQKQDMDPDRLKSLLKERMTIEDETAREWHDVQRNIDQQKPETRAAA